MFTAEAGRNEWFSLQRTVHSQKMWEQRALNGRDPVSVHCRCSNPEDGTWTLSWGAAAPFAPAAASIARGFAGAQGCRRTGHSQQLTSQAGRGICVCSMPLATRTPSPVTPPPQPGWRDLSSLKGNERTISQKPPGFPGRQGPPCTPLPGCTAPYPSLHHQTRAQHGRGV